jgi:hypothetical protein
MRNMYPTPNSKTKKIRVKELLDFFAAAARTGPVRTARLWMPEEASTWTRNMGSLSIKE